MMPLDTHENCTNDWIVVKYVILPMCNNFYAISSKNSHEHTQGKIQFNAFSLSVDIVCAFGRAAKNNVKPQSFCVACAEERENFIFGEIFLTQLRKNLYILICKHQCSKHYIHASLSKLKVRKSLTNAFTFFFFFVLSNHHLWSSPHAHVHWHY